LALNIESELNCAYLRAVVWQAGMACCEGNRHEDNNGIDAQLTVCQSGRKVSPWPSATATHRHRKSFELMIK
jgi:hypothetical protein